MLAVGAEGTIKKGSKKQWRDENDLFEPSAEAMLSASDLCRLTLAEPHLREYGSRRFGGQFATARPITIKMCRHDQGNASVRGGLVRPHRLSGNDRPPVWVASIEPRCKRVGKLQPQCVAKPGRQIVD
ncbi:hypothetical protein GCM10007036_18760 [Alsobacter metallidurans]|uniref:Uncharacterized protein n=1 Tax=Alsobacter metallidurans TaxID=340221 RepID=A0A917I6A1_9HYPH|nr:hypothetical protein GCM10007036_18760 [Alsobacter metallidurans]